jgi:hypothetical protein
MYNIYKILYINLFIKERLQSKHNFIIANIYGVHASSSMITTYTRNKLACII